jgi:RHS repeat-associated protein
VIKPTGLIITYTYDAFNRRTSKTVDGKTTEFIWQGSKLIAETDNDKHWQSYLYEPHSYRPLALVHGNAQQDNIKLYWYQNDHLGTPIALTGSLGDTLYECQYNAYGQIINETYHQDDTQTLPDNPLRFQGQYYDEETGLHYNLNRYYDPFTGRYITQDPLGILGGLNSYQYVNGDPINWIDPLGLIKGLDGSSQPLKLPHYPDKPADINGKINIGAGKTPLEGYYNIDNEPIISVVHKGDAMNLPNVKTGSQAKINIDNPYRYEPLNPEILRILSNDGEIKLLGNLNANKYFRNAIKLDNLKKLNLKIISRRKTSSNNYKLSDGRKMNDKILDEVTLRRE